LQLFGLRKRAVFACIMACVAWNWTGDLDEARNSTAMLRVHPLALNRVQRVATWRMDQCRRYIDARIQKLE